MTFRLDHTGQIRRDLDRGVEAWERLGFRLAPESPQMGFVPGSEGMRTWATANRCALFRHGYLELIGLRDPSRFNPWRSYMERYEGIHILAFRCDSADLAYPRVAGSVGGFEPPVQRARRTEDGEIRFRNIISEDGAWPEGRIIVIEHQTPDLLWRPSLLEHPNGAVALRSCLVGNEGLAARLTRLGAEGWKEVPAKENGPAMAGQVIAVADLGAAVRLIESNGVELREDHLGRPTVGPKDNNGAIMVLTESNRGA